MSVFLLSERLAELVENHIDFPASSTRTYVGLLKIGRAYQTQGEGQSWNIQTMPIWSNLDITESDYRFMSSHRRPGEAGHNPDEISSKGYFCAKVAVQQSGSALRVLNAGSRDDCACLHCSGGAGRDGDVECGLKSASEVPAKETSGTGTVSATLDTDTNQLKYHVVYSGLTGPATAAYSQGPAGEGMNAKPQVPVKAPFDAPVEGTAPLRMSRAKTCSMASGTSTCTPRQTREERFGDKVVKAE